jgi:hypothetical protein
MRSICVLVSVLTAVLAAPAGAQHDVSERVDTTRFDSVPPAAPAPHTEEQERYLHGLQRVGRGVAQLKTAVDRVTRSEASRDTVSQRRASRRLGGYCGSARSFMRGGRAQMDHAAYSDTTGLKAERLAKAVDALMDYASTCEADAASQTAKVSRELTKRLDAYDEALSDFRVAIGLPSGREHGTTLR